MGTENSCQWAEHGSPDFQVPHFYLSYVLGFGVSCLKSELRLRENRAEILNLEEVLARQTTMSIGSGRQRKDKMGE